MASLFHHVAARTDRALISTIFGKTATSRMSQAAEALSHRERMEKLAELFELYASSEEFWNLPASIPDMQFRKVLPREGGQVVDAFWPSLIEPYAEPVRRVYFGYERNRTAAARLFLHKTPERPAVLLLHGYRFGHFRIEEQLWPVQWLFEQGFDVALPALPFHGVRAPKGNPVFPSSDPRFTAEGFRQAIYDLQALIAALRSRGATSVGVMGMSLGGYTASLLATVAPDLSFLVPVIPVSCLADSARDFKRFTGNEEEQQAQYLALKNAYRMISPLARIPRIESQRVLVLGGTADNITPMSHATNLARHFGASLELFEGGHLLQFGRRRAFRAVAHMLGRLGLLT